MTRLIDADKFKDSMKYVCDSGGWLEPVTTAVKEYVVKNIDAQPTVNAIPVSFIQDRIDSLQELAEYELESNGGYVGKVHTEVYALRALINYWKEKQNEGL